MREDENVARTISFGPLVHDDSELRLCGDPAGRRALELGISDAMNALALSEQGAKAMAIDPDPERITTARRAAEAAGLRIEFHQGDLGDLGFATSASIDLVVAAGTLAEVDDLARVLRQVHRVLKPECSFVISTPHPVADFVVRAATDSAARYGTGTARTISEWYMALYRANFRVDNIQELFPVGRPSESVPSTLMLRARKLGV